MRRKRKKRRFISMGAVRLTPGGSLFIHRKNSHGERRMAALLYCTGMRIEEVLGLRWEDIDTERGCIHIRRAVVHPGRNMPEIKSTKSKAERTIPLPRHLLDELSPKEETGFLLNSYTDLSRETPLSYTEAAKSFKRIQKTMRCRRVYRPRLPRHLCNRMARIPHFYRFDCPSPRIQKN